MSFQKERNTRRYQVIILRKRVAALKKQNALMKEKEKNLEDAKERV